MLENVTNITNLITNLYPIAVLGLQLLQWLVGIGALVVLLIMFKYLAHVTSDITLIHYNDKKSSCKYPTNPIWLRHFIARMVVRIITPWTKYNKAVKNWEESFDNSNNEISSRVNEIRKCITLTYIDTREFIESEDTLIRSTEKTISQDVKGDLHTSKLETKLFAYGKCELRCGSRLVAYSHGGTWLRTLELSLRELIDDEKVRELIEKRDIAYQKMSLLKRRFEIKFAWLVSFMRRWNSILSFEKAKYPGDVNVK